MKRTALFLSSLVVAVGVTLATEQDAAACGGCVVPPNQTASDITDERMLLAVSQTQSTLYDQIRYQGSPESFAWILPIQGTVDVGLSADILFGSVDRLTATTINPPPVSCPGLPAECYDNSPTADRAASAGSSGSGGEVTVLKQENVGPYATVQLKSTNPNALTQWLADNGFQIKPEEKPIIEQYVAEGFDFLALKLRPNKDVKSMRPVRVTMQGSMLSLPLRMAAVGTGAKVGITIWVVGEGRYEPQNFPIYRIEDKDLTWDFTKGASNYTDLRSQNELTFGGRGWELQSSISVTRDSIKNTIQSGGVVGGFPGANAPATTDYLPIEADGNSLGKSAEQVRDEDIADLFAGMSGPSVRITRLRSDVAKTAMNVDFILQASTDQAEISNVHNLTKYTGLQCPVYSGCTVSGYAPTPEEAAARSSAAGNNESFSCRTSTGHGTRNIGLAAVIGAAGLVVVISRSRRRKNDDDAV